MSVAWSYCHTAGFVGKRSATISHELSIGEPQDSTSTSYLAAKAVIEDALASMGRGEKKKRYFY